MNNLRVLIDQSEYSLGQVANLCECKPDTIRRLMAKSPRVSLSIAHQLSAILDCTIEDIWPNPWELDPTSTYLVTKRNTSVTL